MTLFLLTLSVFFFFFYVFLMHLHPTVPPTTPALKAWQMWAEQTTYMEGVSLPPLELKSSCATFRWRPLFVLWQWGVTDTVRQGQDPALYKMSLYHFVDSEILYKSKYFTVYYSLYSFQNVSIIFKQNIRDSVNLKLPNEL